jgi:putative transposase
MPKKGHSEEQILRALRQAESGTRVSEICREYGISDATFYIWKKKYAVLALSELRELRQLREEPRASVDAVVSSVPPKSSSHSDPSRDRQRARGAHPK